MRATADALRAMMGDLGGVLGGPLSAPRWTTWLIRQLADKKRADDLAGDLEGTRSGLLMAVVCATACVVTARRALAVEPTDALRADA